MTPEPIANVRQACTELCVAYARCVDFRDYDALLTLFTADAVLHVGAELRGLSGIREALRRRPDELRTRHVVSNVFVDVHGDTSARGICYLTLYSHLGPDSVSVGPAPLVEPHLIGHYEDRFSRVNGRWCFSARRLQVAFHAQAPLAAPLHLPDDPAHLL